MSIVRCPRCRDEVTVPARATSRALVRCPLCLEQYLLAEALANAPPSLIIIGGEVETAAIEHPSDGDDYKIDSSVFPSAVFQAAALDNSTSAHAAVALARPIIKGKPRQRREEKGGLFFLASVVLGGLLAAPLAQLTLWWVFGVDRLETGPVVARYAAWIVPAKFHGVPATEPISVTTTPVPTTPFPKSQRPVRRDSTKKAEQAQAPESQSGESRRTDSRAGELQKVPDREDAEPTSALRPAIDAPTVTEPNNSTPTPAKAVDKPAEKAKSAQPERTVDAATGAAPPMPDLRDLLPD